MLERTLQEGQTEHARAPQSARHDFAEQALRELIAEVLVEDYLDELRGPQGERGPEGPAGVPPVRA